MKKTYKICKRILAFLVCTIILILSAYPAVAVSRYFKDDSINRAKARFRWFYEQDNNSIDVVYIGSSAIYKYDINTQNFKDYGFTSAGLSTAAQPFKATKYLIKETLKTQKPKLFVVEVRQFVRTAAAAATNSDIYTENRFETYYSSLFSSMKYSLNRSRMIHDILDDFDDALSWDLEFIRHHNSWRDFDSYKDLYKNVKDDTYYKSVAKINGISVTGYHKALEFKDYSNEKTVLEPPKDYIQVLDDLTQYIKDNNLNVVFLSTPYKARKSQVQIQNYLHKYFKENNFEYIDQTNDVKKLGLDEKVDFSDTLHVNLYGAEKWTKDFGKQISQKIGKCEHTKSVDESWNKAIKNWNKEREKLSKELDKRIQKHNKKK